MWVVLFATGQVTDAAARPVAYAFHLAAETMTALLLLGAGVAILKRIAYGRRLFYCAGGMLFIAAVGMLVVYVIAGYAPFIALGALVAGLTVFFLARSRPTVPALVFVALGTILYLELNVLGNLLQRGDSTTGAYVIIAMLVTVPVTWMVLKRSLRTRFGTSV